MKKIPFVKKRIAEEKKKILKDMEHSMNADVDGYVTQLPAEGLKMVFILIYFLKKNNISFQKDIITILVQLILSKYKVKQIDIIYFQETLMEELKRYQGLGMLYHLAFYILGLTFQIYQYVNNGLFC